MRDSSVKSKELRRSILLGMILGVMFAVVFCAGFFLRSFFDGEFPTVFAASTTEQTQSYNLLDEVQSLIDRHYLREQPDYTTRQYAAIRGLLGALGDRNTFFIEPPVAQSESDVLAGTYGGIGVTVQRNEAGAFVLYPFLDGPATRAGIEEGDILLEVNGQPLDPAVQQDAVDQMLRGEVREESGVELTVAKADGEELTVFMLFEVINVPSVMWRVVAEDARIGYIQIMRFTNRTPDELDTAITELRQSDIQAVILDMRYNGGGLLQESLEVAGRFLNGGVVFYERTREGERAFEAEEVGSMTDLPLVVLVNGGTASAAELVAGAIQDRERGILIGQTTYGKGTIQQIFTLSDTSSIHVTSSEWLTPDHSVLDGVGLQPDIAMIPDEAGRDIEMGEAIRYLQEQFNAQDES
ncbi:MAG: S41 family peptidase [bacterium]|nr:S41 family peptidase [bacterium]